MKSSTSSLSIRHLQEVERDYRDRLIRNPCDTQTRLCLAWCLVMQALYEAGQSSMVTALISASEDMETPISEGIRDALDHLPVPSRDTHDLIKSCMRQAVIATQLSNDPKDKTNADHIRAVVRLCSGEETVQEVENEARRSLTELTRAILTTPRSNEIAH